MRRIYNPCRRVQPTPSAPLDVLGSAVVAGAAWRALGGNRSSVWLSICFLDDTVVFLDLAWLYRPEPGHLRNRQLCPWACSETFYYMGSCAQKSSLMTHESRGIRVRSLSRYNWAPAMIVFCQFLLSRHPPTWAKVEHSLSAKLSSTIAPPSALV